MLQEFSQTVEGSKSSYWEMLVMIDSRKDKYHPHGNRWELLTSLRRVEIRSKALDSHGPSVSLSVWGRVSGRLSSGFGGAPLWYLL